MSSENMQEKMIETIKAYGLDDEKVFRAMRKVKRHHFIPEYGFEDAYSDSALPIEEDQTISQPYTVAFMLHHLKLEEGNNVLEVGTGSGWSTAVIKEIVNSGNVTSVEYVHKLYDRAKRIISRLGYDICLVYGNGTLGYPKNSPYDRIIVACAAPEIMDSWQEQLKDGGVIIAPVGGDYQVMVRGTKKGGVLRKENLGHFRFVPLKGYKK